MHIKLRKLVGIKIASSDAKLPHQRPPPASSSASCRRHWFKGKRKNGVLMALQGLDTRPTDYLP